MTPDEIADVLDGWDLRERKRMIDSALNGALAGWERAKSPSGKPGFRGVIRVGRRVIWRSEWVDIWSNPSRVIDAALRELDHRAFDAWKAEKGIR